MSRCKEVEVGPGRLHAARAGLESIPTSQRVQPHDAFAAPPQVAHRRREQFRRPRVVAVRQDHHAGTGMNDAPRMHAIERRQTLADLCAAADAGGHLGTVVSSEHFKDEIKPMDKASEAILALKPVTFRYKHNLDPDGIPQFGLVAEEVAKVNPDLVARDKNGEIYTVRYDAVNAMLLNEFLKEHRKNEEQQATIAQLKSGMEALIATVKEQAAQIQKVSAQLQASKPAPQVADSNY